GDDRAARRDRWAAVTGGPDHVRHRPGRVRGRHRPPPGAPVAPHAERDPGAPRADRRRPRGQHDGRRLLPHRVVALRRRGLGRHARAVATGAAGTQLALPRRRAARGVGSLQPRRGGRRPPPPAHPPRPGRPGGTARLGRRLPAAQRGAGRGGRAAPALGAAARGGSRCSV
ncbi:MAG: hypothetical protein AVDCRST_MAG32-1621, partial [uncultured Nocardioides sp.]